MDWPANVTLTSAITFLVSGTMYLALRHRFNLYVDAKSAKHSEALAALQHQGEVWLARIRGDLEQRAHTHRLCFEAEFNAYRKLWPTVEALRAVSMAMRPKISIGGLPEDELLKRFQAAWGDFEAAFLNERPFYADEVFQRCVRLKSLGLEEYFAKLYQMEGVKDRIKFYDEGAANAAKIAAEVDAILASIRRRIAPALEVGALAADGAFPPGRATRDAT